MSVSDAERGAMRHAFDLARRGPRGVNPQVGAVLLSPDGEILAEGWHRGAGTPHAEVAALAAAPAGAAVGATAVVTLEPCNHRGRTGPCAQALIDAGVARVVYALDDPTPQAAGGAAHLRSAGIEVVGGVEGDAARALLDSWLTVQRLGRPHVTVKWAQSLDGRVAAADGTSRWITGSAAREDVHRRRSEADAILVGTGTVLADDPALTARTPDGGLSPSQPTPVIVGTRPVPADAAVLAHPHPALRYPTHDLRAVIADLREAGIHRVFVEGGPTVASSFVREGLVDEVVAYVAPVMLGGPRLALDDIGVGTIADARRLSVAEVDRLGDDLVVVARPAQPPAPLPAPPERTS